MQQISVTKTLISGLIVSYTFRISDFEGLSIFIGGPVFAEYFELILLYSSPLTLSWNSLTFRNSAFESFSASVPSKKRNHLVGDLREVVEGCEPTHRFLNLRSRFWA